MEPVSAAFARRTLSAAELTQHGARIDVVSDGLLAPRVDLAAPKHLGAELRAALAWRVEAMRAQLDQMAAPRGALVARPGITLPLAPECRARVRRESSSGKVYWVDLRAQRPEPGRCPSCGEAHAERTNTGDCALCNAARVAALRAAGRLPLPAARPDSTWPTIEEWRAELGARTVGEIYVPAPTPTWTCSRCGTKVFGQRDPDDECGRCELARISVCDTSRLGGDP